MIIYWGLVEGGFHGQRTTILTEIVPLEQQSIAVGLSILSQGIGNTVAPLTGGKLKLHQLVQAP